MRNSKLQIICLLTLVVVLFSCKKETNNPAQASCTDGLLNNGEKMTDCGGPCSPCDQPLVASIDFYMRKSGENQDTLLFGDVAINNVAGWVISGFKDTIQFSFDFGNDASLGQHAILNSSNTYVKLGNLTYDSLVVSSNPSVVVTEHDESNKAMSGSFEYSLTNSVNSDTLYIINGAFNDMRYQ